MKRFCRAFATVVGIFLCVHSVAFPAGLTLQEHVQNIITHGVAHTDAVDITNSQDRKNSFFDHVADQHFGLNPNSYATYNPVDSDDKKLRSEFILSDIAPIGGIGVVARREVVKSIALHNYLYETLTRHLGGNVVGFAEHIRAICNADVQILLNAHVPDLIKNKNVNVIQQSIDFLNNQAFWDKVITLISAQPGNASAFGINGVTYASLLNEATQARAVIINSSTGQNAPMNTLGTFNDKFQVISNLQHFLSNLTRLQRKSVQSAFPGARVLASTIYSYAMGLARKYRAPEGGFDVLCPIGQGVFPQHVVGMVALTSWYVPPAQGIAGHMITQAQRQEAQRILVGFIRYPDNGDVNGVQYQSGDIDYSTMYPK